MHKKSSPLLALIVLGIVMLGWYASARVNDNAKGGCRGNGARACPTPTPSPSTTGTPSPTITVTPSPSATVTPTPSPSVSISPSSSVTPSPTSTPPIDIQPSFPIRGAFYYPWFPETWGSTSTHNTHYNPSLGFYNSGDANVISTHIQEMQYAGITTGISSWWGQGTPTDNRTLSLLRGADNTNFRWTLYYEPEGYSNPTVSQLTSDLSYIKSRYGTDTNYLRVAGRPVIFIYGDGTDNCATIDRWKSANAGLNFYLVAKVFSGYRTCLSQPDSWHQYGPAVAADSQSPYSYSISPGFWHYNETSPRLVRDLNRWNQNIRDMVVSGAAWQLVTSYNEWGEGTAVETASEWGSAYLKSLHDNGVTTSPSPSPTVSPSPSPSPTGYPVIAAAGDIACASSVATATDCRQLATSNLLIGKGYSGVLTLGDLQYEAGSYSNFLSYYDPTWGRVKPITYPAPGNHEYGTPGAAGYFQYFGNPPPYYSFDIGGWHFLSLNSNCGSPGVGGCGTGSAQDNWIKADIAAHPNVCTLAYFHHPRFSSGDHGDNTFMDTTWRTLDAGGVDVVLAGHDHSYERFAPMNGAGQYDPSGMREFVVGTGGKHHYLIGALTPNSEVQNDDTYGVLEMTLLPTSYIWNFRPEAGKTFTDSGSYSCS